MALFWFIMGFVFLVFGAHILIDGAVSIGRKLNIPELVIGLTIISLGTSLPELMISIMAAIKGETDLAISNVLGSNIANILLILGVAAVITPIQLKFSKFGKTRLTTYYSIVAVVLLAVFSSKFIPTWANDWISWPEGIIFLILFAIFIYFSTKKTKKVKEKAVSDQNHLGTPKSLIYIVLGLAGLYFGGQWIVEGTQYLAEIAGLSMSTIGIKIVAVATSLPELVASTVAAFKKHSGIAVGNVIGSNIFNIFLVLGLSAIIHPLKSYHGLELDVAMVILSTVVLIAMILSGKSRQISRFEGLLFLAIYALFIIFRENVISLVF